MIRTDPDEGCSFGIGPIGLIGPITSVPRLASYLEAMPNDAFVDNIGDGEMWPRIGGARFFPPGSDAEGPTYVKWRKEGGKWVIAEIAYPQA